MGIVDSGADLSPDECRALLRAGGIGRVGVSIGALPAIFPVRYQLVDHDIVLSPTPISLAGVSLAGAVVAFEADAFDADHTAGWSVLVIGRVEASADPDITRVPSDRISGLRFPPEPGPGSLA